MAFQTINPATNKVVQNFDDMTEALNWMQELRNTYNCTFVCMASENMDSVTKLGVSETGPEYDWKKRRN
jgi:hypothetical protein